MPTFYSGVELIAEDYLAGGLYFYVLGRHRLELAPDGAAKLCLELVHESWFEPYELDIGATWRGTYGPRDLELENEVHGKVRVSMQRSADDAWLVFTSWEGKSSAPVRVLRRE